MPADAISCGACAWPLPPETWRQNEPLPCPGCGKTLRMAIFPAIARTGSQEKPQAAEPSDASCFYHAQNRAVAPCDECGRFLCALCELQVDGRRLCPGCLDAGVRARKNQNLETKRTLYDSIALSLATAPALLVWPSIVAAPVALYYCIRYWKAPGSIVPRTKIRFYLAALFSVAEMAGIGLIIYAMVKVSR